MPKKQTHKKSKSKKLRLPKWLIFVLAIILVALLTFGILGLVKYFKDQGKPIDNQSDTEATEKLVDPDEGDVETVESKDQKDEAEADAERRSENAKNDAGKTIANVTVSYAGLEGENVEASGMIANVVETDGTCNYIFTKGAESVTQAKAVLPSAKNTVCESASLTKNNFSAGVWQVVIEYQSNSAEGRSEPTTFEIR